MDDDEEIIDRFEGRNLYGTGTDMSNFTVLRRFCRYPHLGTYIGNLHRFCRYGTTYRYR